MKTYTISLIVSSIVVIGVIAILAIMYIAILAIMYQALVVVPQNKIEAEERQHEAELRAERLREMQKKNEYELCLAEAYRNYSNNWDSKCEIIGKEADCTMTAFQSQQINDWHTEAKDACLDVFESK